MRWAAVPGRWWLPRWWAAHRAAGRPRCRAATAVAWRHWPRWHAPGPPALATRGPLALPPAGPGSAGATPPQARPARKPQAAKICTAETSPGLWPYSAQPTAASAQAPLAPPMARASKSLSTAGSWLGHRLQSQAGRRRRGQTTAERRGQACQPFRPAGGDLESRATPGGINSRCRPPPPWRSVHRCRCAGASGSIPPGHPGG